MQLVMWKISSEAVDVVPYTNIQNVSNMRLWYSFTTNLQESGSGRLLAKTIGFVHTHKFPNGNGSANRCH